MSRLRVAIIGTGGIAKIHVEALQRWREQAEIIAAVDIDAGRLEQFCTQHSISGCYTDASQMLAAAKPDLVHICTPPAMHCDLIVQCLEAGAWVLCEKPLCASLAELARIQDAERRTGNYCSGVFQWRFGSSAQYLKRMMQDGVLGRSLLSVCHTTWFRDAAYYAVPWRGKWHTELGGPSMGHGIHAMDFLIWLQDDWKEVSAMMDTLDRAIEVEDISLALLRFENGSLASIVNSVLSPRQESYLRFDYQRATVELKHLYSYSDRHWSMSLPEGKEDEQIQQRWQEAVSQNIPAAHSTQIGALLTSREKGEAPAVTSAEAGRVIELITCLYKSACTGRVVQRGSISADDPFYQHVAGPLALKGKQA